MGLDLSIQDLRVETRQGQRLLDIGALDIPAGCVAVICGPSGAGKSTFLHAVAGLVSVASGQVLWGGTDLLRMDDAQRAAFRRTRIGFVFQDHLLFEELDAQSNAALPAAYAPRAERPALRAAARDMLGRLGLGARARQAAALMSGGERQRVAVARALAAGPPIVLADEPTAALDRAAADALTGDLFALARADGRTVLIASHDSALQSHADRLIRFEDGRLIPC